MERLERLHAQNDAGDADSSMDGGGRVRRSGMVRGVPVSAGDSDMLLDKASNDLIIHGSEVVPAYDVTVVDQNYDNRGDSHGRDSELYGSLVIKSSNLEQKDS